MQSRAARLIGVALAIATLYIGSYACLRYRWAETWQVDGRRYVIFPAEPVLIYYCYRPLTYLDSGCTGIRFHIGPHQTTEFQGEK